MDYPLISIITPCYNSQEYLRETISSVLNQSYRNFEWILINDGSSDKTEEIILEIEVERIKYLYQENKGQCAASNLGLSQSKGQFIKFLDSDDLLNDTHLENLVKCIVDNETLVSCAWGRFYKNDIKSFKKEIEDVSKSMESFRWLKTALTQRHDMMPGWLWLIPKKIIEKTGGWDERFTLNNDFEFSVRLLLASKQVIFCNQAILYYRTNSNTLSSIFNEESLSNAISSNLLGIGYILERENTKFTRRICANRLQEWVFITYPTYPKLYRLIQSEIKKLGGSNLKIGGGVKIQIFRLIFGWKLTLRIKALKNKKWK